MQTDKVLLLVLQIQEIMKWKKYIQRYNYRDQEVEGIVETRMRQNNEIKTTTQVFLPDPNSLMQRIKRANV